MGKEILTFGDIEIEKNKFDNHKYVDVDIEKVLVSSKIFVVEKTIITLLVTCIIS